MHNVRVGAPDGPRRPEAGREATTPGAEGAPGPAAKVSAGTPPRRKGVRGDRLGEAARAAAPTEPAARLYVVDGSAYVFRAFHAIPFLSTSKGVPTNAVFGFATMLFRLLREERPSHIVVVFDAPGETFRDSLYPEYKANRTALPDELAPQLPIVRRVVETLAIPILEEVGVEADDVIGTLATRIAAGGMEVVIVTGDKDFQQLVSPTITLLDTMQNKRTTLADVEQRYGLRPERWTDVVGLMGDAIDNIPGIRGVGEKTAAALIRHCGSLEVLLDDPACIETSGIRGARQLVPKLREHAEQARLSKTLATIRQDLRLTVTLDDFRYGGPRRAELEDLCRELEFHSLLRDLGPLAPIVVEVPDVPVRTGAAVLEEIGRASTCAVVLATSSDAAMRADLLAVTVAPARDAAVAVPYPREGAPAGIASGAAAESVFGGAPVVRALLADPGREKVGEDVKRALVVLARHGLALAGPLFDTTIASYVLDPSRPSHDVAELARHFLRRGAPEAASDDARAAWQARTLLELRPVLERALAEHDALRLFREIEMPLTLVLAAMERRGVRVDEAAIATLGAEFRATLVRLEREIHELAGGEFNIGSTPQLRTVLFERLKISTRGIRKGKTGFSTDIDVLTRLAEVHPLPAKILEYRAIAKLLSTYVDPLAMLVHPETGRIHTCFNQTVTATGRLSSTNPNLQNIPIRTEEGRRIRAAFIAAEGKRLIAADYSQIELRILAHLSDDPTLVEAFTTSEDVHTRTAAEVFEVAPALVTSEMRRRAKVINFGIIYGMGPQRLARELAIPYAEAQRYIESYFARYAGVTRFIEMTLAEARRQGYVSTLLNRRRYLPELMSREEGVRQFAERTAINTPVQGSAADLIKLAMVRLEASLGRQRAPASMILQVHDELLFEVEAAVSDAAMDLIREEMETVLPLRVPLKVDIRTGMNWNEAH